MKKLVAVGGLGAKKEQKTLSITKICILRNIYGSSRVGVEEVNQELLMEPLLDYLPLKPVLLTPLSDQCATTGMWYYDVTSTTSTITNINADNYDDVKFTNTNTASNPYSAQVVMNVVPGQTYTLTYDYLVAP